MVNCGKAYMGTVFAFHSGNSDRLYFLGLQNHLVTAAAKLKYACSSEEKLWQTYNISKRRDITLPTEVHLIKAVIFLVVIYGYKSWTIKKAECRRINAFELWCCRRLLRVPWIARSNQSIVKEISPEYSLAGLMLKLKLQYFGHLMWRTDSFVKTLRLGKIEGRRRGRQRMRWLYGITDLMDMSSSKLQDRESWHAAVHSLECKESDRTEQLNWTELKIMVCGPITSWQKEEKNRWKHWPISSSWALKSLRMVTAAMKS